MAATPTPMTDVMATVIEVLPGFGLAWLRDEASREWAVTRSTMGIAFDTLTQGARVQLHVVSVDGCQFADSGF